MSTENLIPAKSAMPASMKKAILVQDGLRRIRNNCPSTLLEDQVATIRKYNVAMFNSGYSEKDRLQVTKSVMYKYQAQLDSHKDGSIAFYRSKQERLEYKKRDTNNSLRTGWFTKLGFDATLVIPSTPKSELLKMVKNKIQNVKLPKNFKVLLRENNGQNINCRFLNAINLWPQKECLRKNCMICWTDGRRGN